MDSIVLGKDTRVARHRQTMDFELPDYYAGDSLFDLQETAAAEANVAVLPAASVMSGKSGIGYAASMPSFPKMPHVGSMGSMRSAGTIGIPEAAAVSAI